MWWFGDYPGVFNGLQTIAFCVNFNWMAEVYRNLRDITIKPFAEIDDWDIACEISLRSKLTYLTGDKSTLVKLMTWCRQALNHWNHCWPRSMSSYGFTRPQWVHVTDQQNRVGCKATIHIKRVKVHCRKIHKTVPHEPLAICYMSSSLKNVCMQSE